MFYLTKLKFSDGSRRSLDESLRDGIEELASLEYMHAQRELKEGLLAQAPTYAGVAVAVRGQLDDAVQGALQRRLDRRVAAVQSKTCAACGTTVVARARFCIECGAAVTR